MTRAEAVAEESARWQRQAGKPPVPACPRHIRLEGEKKKRHVSDGNASVREEILSEATNLQQMAAVGGEGGGGEIAALEKAKRRHQESSQDYYTTTPGRIVYKS